MELKQKHKDFLKENNLNSISDVAFHIERLKESGENRQMMLDLVWILVNEKSCLLDFFAENNPVYNKQVDLVNQLAFNLKQNRINATRLKAENCMESGIFSYPVANDSKLNFTFIPSKDPVEIYTFSWRPSQKTESVLTDKTVHYNPFNDGNYCPKKQRVKDAEKLRNEMGKEFETPLLKAVREEEEQKAREKVILEQWENIPESYSADWIDFIGSSMKRGRVISYESPLAPKQKDKVTTDDLKVFKKPEVKDCTIKDGKVEYGVKESEGKVNYEELDWDYIDGMTNRMSDNLDKYPPKNWQKSMNIKKLAESSIRHARKILQEIDKDEETLQEHAYALGCNGMMINYQLKVKK